MNAEFLEALDSVPGGLNIKILHIVPPEKFLKHVVVVSEALNRSENVYAKIAANGKISRIDVSTEPEIGTGFGATAFRGPEDMIAQADAIFVHGLWEYMCDRLSNVRPETVLVWCGMGADYIRFAPAFRDNMLLPATKRHARLGWKKFWYLVATMKGWRRIIRKLFSLFHPDASGAAAFKKLVPRIDFFCVREQGLRIEKTLSGFRAKEIANFGYYSLENVLSVEARPIDGPDILIGNSATWTNNHFDLFRQLRGVELRDRRIVLPLSYGEPRCKEVVVSAAARTFGRDRIDPLLSWMPIGDYNRALSRCGTVLMNHVRGQAMGNLNSMILRGAKVYIRRENPYADFFEELGVKFFYIPSGRFDQSVFDPLTADERRLNAELMQEFWMFENVKKRTAKIFDIVEREVMQRRQTSSAGEKAGNA